jgi:DDE domain
LIISMDDSETVSLEQIQAFLAGNGEVRFAGQRRAEVYAWVERTLVRHAYAGLGRADKGVVRKYIARMTGLSRAQATRLIAGHGKTGQVKAAAYQRTKFARRYTAGDVELLAYVDQAHGNLSGPATKRFLEQDHRAIKRRVNAKQGFREFQAAQRTIQGYEAMNMLRNGQVRWVSGTDVRRQVQFINKLFELAA